MTPAAAGRERLWLRYSLFTARAWVLGDSGKSLQGRLDVSWTARGDLFYMHKLAETIKAYRSVAP